MKKYLHGFTFIELLLSIALMGVITATAIPRYIDSTQQTKDDTLWAQSVAVKNAHDAVINRNSQPTVANLATEAFADATAVAHGVQIQISGAMYVVPTYSNALCTEPTKSVNDPVRCIGTIAG